MKTVVRVATSNNFNCTDAEYAQLDGIAAANPDKLFFVNSNVRTPLLRNILCHSYQAVITVNPDLFVDKDMVEKAQALSHKVSFYRVKWLPKKDDIVQAIEDLLPEAPVVITMQRFNSIATLESCTSKDYYAHDCSRFRLHGDALEALEAYVDAQAGLGRKLYICDRKGLGCLGCGLCATLNGAKGAEIKSLNLSTSGVCPYSCVDCYAKAMQKFLVGCGNKPMKYDTIMKNKKQKGTTKHIQNARKERKAA